ncbi:MAG: hypothetical protein MZV70_22665 [Desulfobacterales bacterium]|nr:hypothetical protein [Desulfobacterales bacterium]
MLNDIYRSVVEKDPNQPEFHQAVQEVVESLALGAREAPRVPHGEDPRAHRRARARDHVPRALGRRQGRGPGQPRLPHRDEQRHRPLQGRPALPPVGEPRHPQVPRLRAGLQELA